MLKEILMQNFISKFDFFDEDIDKILKHSHIIKLEKGEIFYKDVKSCYGYIILLSGSIRAYVTSKNLKEITVFNLKSGDECMLCSNCRINSFNNELNLMIEESSEFILIPNWLFSELKDRYSSLANHILTLMARRFNEVIEIMQVALFVPLSNRVDMFLKQNAKESVLTITHEEIANHLGSSREVISRILKDMEKLGVIEQKRRVIKLL